MKIWLDDERPAPEGWFWCHTAAQAIDHLNHWVVSEISLDHDLGDDAAGTGYNVLLYMEMRTFYDGSYPVPTIRIHTANPSARIRMEAAVESIVALKGKGEPLKAAA